MKQLFANTFQDRTVLVTGHTGFKGSWLSLWLTELGANVIGYSLPDPPTQPSNFELMDFGRRLVDIRGDIRDLDHLTETVATYQPSLVFHLAAQPIVLRSFEQPRLTFETNALGTVNALEAIRASTAVRALVSITTDKVYENEEWLWGYRENDRLGGYDPYSASKAMAELAIASYRHSFFSSRDGQDSQPATKPPAVASVRAGNVIGGGDFADYRLVPDCMRALMAAEPILIRNPNSIRPWQHVLEPLSGYLWLAVKLLQEGQTYAQAWNFGPLEQQGVTTQYLAEKLVHYWGSGSWESTQPTNAKAETGYLRLSWEKAASAFQWRPVYTLDEALAEITVWFQAYQGGADIYEVSREHIATYTQRAADLKLAWTR